MLTGIQHEVQVCMIVQRKIQLVCAYTQSDQSPSLSVFARRNVGPLAVDIAHIKYSDQTARMHACANSKSCGSQISVAFRLSQHFFRRVGTFSGLNQNCAGLNDSTQRPIQIYQCVLLFTCWVVICLLCVLQSMLIF